MKNLWKTSTLTQKIGVIVLAVLTICCVYWSLKPWFPDKPVYHDVTSTEEVSSKEESATHLEAGLSDMIDWLRRFAFNHLTLSQKQEITESVENAGGTIVFEKDCWIITMEDGTITFYSDNTYTIIDNNGKIVVDTHNH